MTEPMIQSQRILDGKVLAFTRNWHLNGVYLRCTSCGSGQKASDADLLFVHENDCSRFANLDYPWRELSMILQWVPSEDVVYI